jgi:hypothetical protein
MMSFKDPVIHTFIRKPEIIEMDGDDFVFKSPIILANSNRKLILKKIAVSAYRGGSSVASREPGLATDNVNIDRIAENIVKDSFHGKIERDSKGEVDLVAEFKKHPDALWIRVKAIEAGIPNDNGDCFDIEEIKKSYRSFEGCPVFTNHENTKVENAKGKVVKAELDEKEGAVYCTMFIDRKANAPLCRAIEEGYVTDVSMGTQVEYSTCSECKNKAYTAEDYCKCVKTRKGRKNNGKMVYENNYGLKFIEISVVTDGACKDCTIREVLDPDDLMSKVSSVVNAFKKTAAFTKDSGQAEIQKLNQAMDLLEDVSRSMLDQRQYIDLEYLSKVTDVLADLQHVNDELVDQGYGSIGAQPAQPSLPQPPTDGVSLSDGAGGPSPSMTGAEGVGKVTSPATAKSKMNVIMARIKDLQENLEKNSEETNESRGGVTPVDIKAKRRETIMKLAKIWENPSVKKYVTEVSDGGEFKIAIANDEVLGLRNGKKIASLKKADLDAEVKAYYEADPVGCAKELLEELKASVEAGRIQKTAEVASDEKQQHESTMEKQLEEQKLPLHPRENDERDETMEGQLSKKRDSYDQHARQNSTKESTTEKQLGESEKGYDYHKRQGVVGSAEQTMELQLRDEGIHGNDNPADRKSPVEGSPDQRTQPIGGQLDDWRKGDKGFNPTDAITEKQLKEQGEPWGRRIASKEDAKLALAAGTKALVQTSIAMGATPEEMLSIISDFGASPMNTIAAMNAVRTLSAGKENRESLYKRSKFHGASKIASKSAVADFILGSLSDNGLSGEVGIKVLAGIASRKNALSEIGEAIVAGAADDDILEAETNTDYLKEVLASDDSEETVIVEMNASKIAEDPKNADKFATAAFAIATKSAAKNGYKISQNVQVAHKNNGVIEVTMKGVKAAVEQAVEKTEPAKVDVVARKEARRKLIAQMGGATPDGGMGMGGGAPPGGGGGGTTMPTPPPADPAAGGAPPTSSLGEPPPGEGDDDKPKGEALPPGSICPVCGSDQVDLRGGEFDCKDCGAHGSFEVSVNVDSWPSTIEDTTPKGGDEEEGEDGGIGDMAGGEGMEMPPMGLAAAFKITPEMIKKAGNKPIGSYCPHCASSKVKLASKKGCVKGNCEHCGGHYRVDCFVDKSNDLWARMAWKDKGFSKFASAKRQNKVSAEEANKAKAKALNMALAEAGLTMKFVKANAAKKAAIVGGLIEKGLLKIAYIEGDTQNGVGDPNQKPAMPPVGTIPTRTPPARPVQPATNQEGPFGQKANLPKPGVSNTTPSGRIDPALLQKMQTATPEQISKLQQIMGWDAV